MFQMLMVVIVFEKSNSPLTYKIWYRPICGWTPRRTSSCCARSSGLPRANNRISLKNYPHKVKQLVRVLFNMISEYFSSKIYLYSLGGKYSQQKTMFGGFYRIYLILLNLPSSNKTTMCIDIMMINREISQSLKQDTFVLAPRLEMKRIPESQ